MNLRSMDGRVFYREWACNDPKGIIILVHGLGGYSGRFTEMGGYLCQRGLKVYAIELKGFGESPAIKGHVSDFDVYSRELKLLVEQAKSENPHKKIFMFGESLGGLITLNFGLKYQDMLTGMILVSPAIKDKLSVSLLKRAKIMLAAIRAPLQHFDISFDAAVFTRDPNMIKKINEDPLEVRSFSARFLLASLMTLINVNLNAKKFNIPTLMLLAGRDKMISAEAAAAYFKKMSSKDKELKWYPEMYHALYVDRDREKVFEDIVNWISKRV